MEREPSAPEIRLRGKSKAKYLDYRGLERTSLFLKHGRDMDYLRRDMAFERPLAYRSVETARILSLMLDKQHVPHARFEVTIRRGGQNEVSNEGLRTLSLKAFADIYCKEDASARFACHTPSRPGSFGRALRGGLRRLLPAPGRRPAAYPETPAKTPARDDAGVFLKSA